MDTTSNRRSRPEFPDAPRGRSARRPGCRRVVGAMVLVAAAAIVWGQSFVRNPKDPPRFQTDGYKLTLRELEFGTEIEWGERPKREHELSIEGAVAPPKDKDVVALRKDLKAVKALDAMDKDRVVREDETRRRSRDRYRDGSFSAVLDGSAEVELNRLNLTGSAAFIRTLTVETEALIAERRESLRLPAVVSKEWTRVVGAAAVRIESLKLDDERMLTVVVRSKRRSGGPVGPFADEVAALDGKGIELGRARWSRGDPLAEEVRLTAEFKLAGAEPHKFIRLVFVTEHKTEKVAFEIRDVFGQ